MEAPPPSPDCTAQKVSPLPNETHHAVESTAAPAFPRPHFLAPYLKGKPVAKAWITMLLLSSKLSLPALMHKRTVVVRALYKAGNAGWPQRVGHAAPQRRQHWASDA